MWFKSDISVYDREDFQFAWEECNCLSVVWEWIQRESVKAQSETVRIKNNLYLKGVLKKLHISEAEFRDAQRLLGEMELIIFDDPNIITLPNWLLNQGSWFAEKQRNAAKIANWREQKKKEKENCVTVTEKLRDSNVAKCNVLEESKRRDRVREEIDNNINIYNSSKVVTLSNHAHKAQGEGEEPELENPVLEAKSHAVSKKLVYSSQFEEFWALYGRKGSKTDAEKAFVKALSKIDFSSLLVAVKQYLSSHEATKEGGKYKMHASRYLNGQCWESNWQSGKVSFSNPDELREVWDTLPLERKKSIEAVAWLNS